MPRTYPQDQKDRATKMVLDRLNEYPSVWAGAQALAPKLGIGAETLRKWVVQPGLSRAARAPPRTYRSWKKKPPSYRAHTDAQILDTHRHIKTGGPDGRPLPEVLYGRRKMTPWLRRNGFEGLSKHTVDRLMRQEHMLGLVRGRRTRTTIRAKDGVRAGDLLNPNFCAPYPNHGWVTDFT